MGHRRARHFYPRSPCGERPAIGRRDRAGRDISIHALLAESDLLGRDDDMTQLEFLSTLSLRRATGCRCPPRHWHGGFLSTLSLRRATIGGEVLIGFTDFSIHALLAESDGIAPTLYGFGATFLSTLSLRRATPPRHWHGGVTGLFYPRSPCGERRHWQTGQSRTRHFLSTLSLRRATWN